MWHYLLIPIVGVFTFVNVIKSKQKNFGHYYYIDKLTASIMAPMVSMLLTFWVIEAFMWIIKLLFRS